MDESVYMINLRDAFEKPRNKRAKRAMKMIREFIAKHSKTPLENVRLSNHLNSLVWARGIQKPPRRVKVKMIRSNGKSYVYHIDEKIEVPKEETKEKKEAKEQAKEEKKEETKKKEAPVEKKLAKKGKDKDKKAAASNKQEDIG
ncbi:MAG: 50S ribosomal protein L31e [Candidatus Micrarchaeota archaeon]|nr:50S ribosomal protein L31e [Candidatus Micrarchaeota archaeon]